MIESSAAVYASEYSVNGFSDWFLPSKDELNELYENQTLIGGVLTGYYWSSSEFDAGYAWLQNFSTGIQDDNIIFDIAFVLPVRAFP